MKIYNSKAQTIVHMVAFSIFIWIFVGKLNTEPKYAVAYYDFLGQFIKGLLISLAVWIPLTIFCSKMTIECKKSKRRI